MKIQSHKYVQPTLTRLPQPQKPVGDSYRPEPFDRERNQAGYAHIARSMALGAGIGGVVGAAANLFPILPGVPTGLATGLTTAAGLVAGAWLGVGVGYAGCF